MEENTAKIQPVVSPRPVKSPDSTLHQLPPQSPSIEKSPSLGAAKTPCNLSRPKFPEDLEDSQATTSSQNAVSGNEGTGNIFGDDLDVYERAEASRNVTTKDYDNEWKRFQAWLHVNGPKYGVTIEHLFENKLTSSGLDYLLAEYVSNRHNITVRRRDNIIVRLDPNTLAPLVSRLCSMIERNTQYRPSSDTDFRLLKSNVKYYTQQAKKVLNFSKLQI